MCIIASEYYAYALFRLKKLEGRRIHNAKKQKLIKEQLSAPPKK